MGAAGLGQFASVFAFMFIFQSIASLGFPYLITREVAIDKTKAWDFLLNSSVLGLFFSLGTGIIMCITIRLVTDDEELARAGYMLSIALIPNTLSTICQAICRAFEKFEYIAYASIVGNAVRVTLGLIVLFNGYGLYYLIVVVTGSYFVVFLMSSYFVHKCIPEAQRSGYKPNLALCKWIIVSSPVFALILISSDIRLNIDTLVLTNLMGSWDVGIYNAGNKLTNLFRLGASSYILALQPIIFKLSESSKEKFQRACTESIRYLFILILPVITFVMMSSEKIILLIFKEEFLPSADVLRILIWMLLLYGMNQIYANVLISNNDQKVNLLANLVSTAVSVVLNIAMIPKFGYIGAGVASIVSYALILFIQHYAVRKKYFKINYLGLLKKPLLASIVMGASLVVCRNASLYVSAPVSLISFVAALFAFKTFTQEDIDRFSKLWSGKHNINEPRKQVT
jgi:O-antigen/teichoic acid export membrane protein